MRSDGGTSPARLCSSPNRLWRVYRSVGPNAFRDHAYGRHVSRATRRRDDSGGLAALRMTTIHGRNSMSALNLFRSNPYRSGVYRTVARSLVVLLLMLLAAGLNAAASVQGSFERTLKATGPVDLEVLSRYGDITVRSGPAGTVT